MISCILSLSTRLAYYRTPCTFSRLTPKFFLRVYIVPVRARARSIYATEKKLPQKIFKKHEFFLFLRVLRTFIIVYPMFMVVYPMFSEFFRLFDRFYKVYPMCYTTDTPRETPQTAPATGRAVSGSSCRAFNCDAPRTVWGVVKVH